MLLSFDRLGRGFGRSRDYQAIVREDVHRGQSIDRFGSTEGRLSRAGVGRAGFWGVNGPGIDKNEGGCGGNGEG